MSPQDQAKTPRARTTARLDPLGKRALFGAPVSAAPDSLRANRETGGRDALFSVGPRESGTVVVDCSDCRSKMRIGLPDAALRVAALSIYAPLVSRKYPHRIKCPSCNKTRWCRIGWND